MTEVNETRAEASETELAEMESAEIETAEMETTEPGGHAGFVTVADAAVRLSVSIPRLRRLLARPEWAYYARQVQRETKTGTRTSTVLPESVLPQIQDAFTREQQMARAEVVPFSDPRGGEPSVGLTMAAITPLVDALLREKDARITELQRYVADLQADKEQLYRALTRAQVASVLPPPDIREAPPAPEEPRAVDGFQPAEVEPAELVAASWEAAAPEPVFGAEPQEHLAETPPEEHTAETPPAEPPAVSPAPEVPPLPESLAPEPAREPMPEPADPSPADVLSADWQPVFHAEPAEADPQANGRYAVPENLVPEPDSAPASEEEGRKLGFWSRFRATQARMAEPSVAPDPLNKAESEKEAEREEPMPDYSFDHSGAMTPADALPEAAGAAPSGEAPAGQESPLPEEMPLFAFSDPTEVKMPRWLEEELAEKRRAEGQTTPATWNQMPLLSPEAVAEAAANRVSYAEPEPLTVADHGEEPSPHSARKRRGAWEKLSDWIKD